MAKKTATYANYELRVEDNGKIVILNDGQLVQNAKGAIRTIAADVSFTIDPKWNTQSAGRKLIDFLNSTTATSDASAKAEESSASTEVPEPAPKPTPKPVAEPEAASANHNTDNELTEEEMKQLDELLKRIDTLETRLERLEKSVSASTSTQQSLSKGGVVGKSGEYIWSLNVMKFKDNGAPDIWSGYCSPNYRNEKRALLANGNYDFIETTSFYCHLWLLSDRRLVVLSRLGDTLREVKAFATLVGYPIPDKAKKEQLAAAIVSEKGRDGFCISGDQILTSNGIVYKMSPFDFEGHVAKLKRNPSIVIPEAPSVDGKVDHETFKLIKMFYNGIKGRPVPDKETMLAFFDKEVENYKLKRGE
ncbi:MAG: hypothetical protein K2I92_08325 [Muribaculaceae bacterium]|nr:hypothetical protein [Muribaculaceae bacterium]